MDGDGDCEASSLCSLFWVGVSDSFGDWEEGRRDAGLSLGAKLDSLLRPRLASNI